MTIIFLNDSPTFEICLGDVVLQYDIALIILIVKFHITVNKFGMGSKHLSDLMVSLNSRLELNV